MYAMKSLPRFVMAATLTLAAALIVSPGTASAASAGDVTSFTQSGSTYNIAAGSTQVRVIFSRADIFRIWLAPTGSFTDPAGTDLTINTNFGATTTNWSDAGTYYRINTSAVTLRVNKSPLRFSAYRPDNTTLIWSESTGISWTGSAATQTLTRGSDEQFYGTGLRLGDWALRDKTVPIKVYNSWNENDNASPAPFYMSTNGYGVLRNTWAQGSYAFGSPVATTMNENRFDAYYFIGDQALGNSLKDVLNAYTDVTGKPFLAPLWGFELGNADCFNASNPAYTGNHNRPGHQVTPDIVAYAQEARNKDMPSGWFLPNDGYGCGYTNLPQSVSGLAAQGFHTGLWTSTGLSNIAYEVGTAGSRGVKTDVAWIGSGYKYAFDGVNQAVNGLESNSNARRYVWTVDGWAGTQRNAIVWTGDTEGDWANMRWHVPAIAGAGLSALNYATGDVDGIYSGSPDTYARDLQWKAFTPAFMTMSGWGATNPSAGYNDKQPWRYSDPYLSINRKYLKLKMRLMPYHYTMSRNASLTGTPATRALVLEYPNDPVARGNTTSGEFMAGDSFLVAPVVTNTSTRDGIYLPAGTWTDYWTGQVRTGPVTVNGYSAPLGVLPLFVKGGAIVPMWPQMNYTGEKPVSTLTYDLYPRGSSSFTLYEDDGITRAYQTGSFATQQVNVTAPASGTGDVTVSVGASNGSYTGKPASRGYEFTVHLSGAPSAVSGLSQLGTKAAYDAATTGWYFDPADRGGLLWVKAGNQSGAFSLTLTGATLPGSGGGGDTIAPSTPGTPTASGVTSSSANLAWAASTDNVGVTGYDVFRAPGTSGGTFTQVGTAAGNSFTATGLSASSTYRFYVRARDAAGNTSANSGTVTVTTTAGGGSPLIPKTAWSLSYADSQESAGENGAAANAFDGNTSTIWHTKYNGGVAPLPHEIQIDMRATYAVDSVRYLPRQVGINGRIGQYEIYVSADGVNWGTAVATGTFADTATEKIVNFTATTGRYLRLRALTEAGARGQWSSAAEISATGI
jgi:alpha-glucosidase (family GH31 glycosyl hydrolase)